MNTTRPTPRQLSALIRGRVPVPVRSVLASLGQRFGIVGATAVLFSTLSLTSGPFLTRANLLNILQQNAPVGILALGATPAIIAGGIDLSLAATYTLGGVVAADVVNHVGLVPGILAGLMTGTIIGAVNGFLSTVCRINSLITTLASGIIVSGVAVLITGGFLVTVTDNDLLQFGNAYSFGAPYGVWIFALAAVLGQIVLSKTTAGRRIFASGESPEAARLSGVRVAWVRTAAFVCSGFGAALAGIIVSAEVGQATPQTDQSVLFTALAAIVIGGNSIYGGEGAMWRTVLGVLFLALVTNGLDLLAVSPSYTGVIEGAIILAAVGLDALGKRARPGLGD